MLDRFQREMYGRETLQTEEGYIMYEVYEDKSAYIHQMYILPEHRHKGVGKQLEDAIINKHDLKMLSCYVDLTSSNPELSLLAIIKAGYLITGVEDKSIILGKEV